MSFFLQAVEGLVDALARTAIDNLGFLKLKTGSAQATEAVERPCKEIGRKVDERDDKASA